MGKPLCICQICNCGRHRCPHRPLAKKAAEPCVLTEYNNRYTEHPMQRTEPFKPKNVTKESSGPLSDETTFKTDYIQHPLSRPDAFRPVEQDRTGGDMDFTTSYKKEYIPKRGPVTQPIKRIATKKVAGKFEGEPTYKNDFRKWPMERSRTFAPDVAWKAPVDTFGGNTTFQHDFVQHPVPPRLSFKPMEAAKSSDAPFDDATDYKQSYVKHALPPRDVKEKTPYVAPKAPLDSLTTFQRDYFEHPLERQAAFKPQAEAHKSDGPFDDRTNYKTDFKLWPAEKPHIHEPDAYIKPQGQMDMDTSYKTNYIPHPMYITKTAKPVGTTKKVDARFDGNTHYKDDFRKWPMMDRQKPTMRPDYKAPEAPFEGMSQYTSHYIPHPMTQPKSFKPEEFVAPPGDFEGHTMYKQDYVPKWVEPCPAALLNTGASKYSYIDENPRGHKFYKSIYNGGGDMNLLEGQKLPEVVGAY